MPAGQAEPFSVALAELRDRLRDGAFTPGARIAATEVAETLRLSATPVREALSRLAGEGLLEDRRGQGFFLRTLSGLEVADLYRMSLEVIDIAQASERARAARPASGPDTGGLRLDPVATVERLLAEWVAEAGSRILSLNFRTLQTQLGPIRRVESALIRDLAVEAAEMAEARDAGVRRDAQTRFHHRRIALADRLAALAYRGGEPPPQI